MRLHMHETEVMTARGPVSTPSDLSSMLMCSLARRSVNKRGGENDPRNDNILLLLLLIRFHSFYCLRKKRPKLIFSSPELKINNDEIQIRVSVSGVPRARVTQLRDVFRFPEQCLVIICNV
jgi:hypothetical protein